MLRPDTKPQTPNFKPQTKNMEKKYWKGLEELQNDPEFVRLRNDEFFELIPIKEEDFKSEGTTPRRDFLKYLGFGVAAASLAACTAPVKKAIPYLIKPEEITPGVPDFSLLCCNISEL